MAVLAIGSHPRCKLCSHTQRPAIDALLEMRSRRQTDEKGENVNLDYVLRVLTEWGIENPNEDNVKNHWKKHCQLVDEADAAKIEGEADALTEARVAVWERIFGEDWMTGSPTPEQILEWQRAEYLFTQYARVKAGKETGISHDQLDRAINTTTRRSSEEKADSLVKMLGEATGTALVNLSAAKRAEAEAAVDVEVSEEAEVVGELPAGG